MGDIYLEKSFAFAVKIVELSDVLASEKREFVLSRKILDSGTNIGLFIEEAKQGSNREDFIAKYSLANKEAFKTNFLLRLLNKTGKISSDHFSSLITDCEELQKLLISAIKTARSRI